MTRFPTHLSSVIDEHAEQFVGALPKWSRYIPHDPFPKQLAFLMLATREALFGGAAGGGKILSDNGTILTPFGFKKGKDVRVGDLVNNPDGSIARIVQVKRRVTLQAWTVHFHDGTKTTVAADHLWLAWRSGKRKKRQNVVEFGESAAEVIETRELKEWLDEANRQDQAGVRPNWPCIPVCDEQRFNVTQRYQPDLDPYLLGVLIGDGSFTNQSVSVTSADHTHTRNTLAGAGVEYSVTPKKGPKASQYSFRGKSLQQVRTALKRVGLHGRRSWEKHIPRYYLFSSVKTRYAVLQGLMDTDGYASEKSLYYTTTSKQLANDVETLVRSLGGIANTTSKIPTYTDGKGDKQFGRRAYTVYIKHREPTRLFRLPRKITKAAGQRVPPMYRRVVKVEVKGKVTGRCITVSHPNGLYLTNDFIVTHNSDALLMAALQYADVPGYSAIIFRRTFTELKEAGGLIHRSHEWLEDTGAKYSQTENRWTIPTDDGGRSFLAFGHLDSYRDRYKYQSAEFQYVAFDELAHFEREDYTYVGYSRLRRPQCEKHKIKVDPDCKVCLEYLPLRQVPLRLRSATNPPGMGQPAFRTQWIKEHFSIQRNPDGTWQGNNPHRPFIPSFIHDNLAISKAEYEAALQELDPVTRAQLMKGDWGATHAGRFKQAWARYYSRRGPYIVLGPQSKGDTISLQKCWCFVIVDPAVSAREGPGDTDIWARRMPSWSVISTWIVTPNNHLLWWHNYRCQSEVPDVRRKIIEIYTMLYNLNKDPGNPNVGKFRPEYIGIEWSSLSAGLVQDLERTGLPIKRLSHESQDKLVRATQATNMMEQGKLWFPESHANNPWKDHMEEEIFSWTGHPHETSDQVDCLAYAAREVVDLSSMQTMIKADIPDVMPLR